ncbi:MAG: hypothetical protein WBW84_02075 [Acidobacteriaceae bacterium]
MRATSAPVVFLVNLGTADRPAYQPLSNFVMHASMAEYWTVKDRADPGDHRKENLGRG